MSELKSGISRRGFLKTTAAAAGAAALVGTTTALAYEPGQIAADGETIYRGLCSPNCFAFCHLNVHVRDGKVVKTSRAPYNEACYTRICQRGLSQVQRVYDPNRVLHPLKRKEGTARGAGEWEQLTWDEAFTQVAAAIKSAQDQYGKGAVAGLSISGNMRLSVQQSYGRFWNLLGASTISPNVDNGNTYGFARTAGAAISNVGYLMWEGNEPTDAKNAKTIVMWGANATDAQIQNWHLIKEAIQGGTKLVVVDPIFTVAASKAHKWIPVRPATDTALKYGIMHEVLEAGAVDVPFMRDKTVAPFLVRSDNGMFVRASDFLTEADFEGLTEEEIATKKSNYGFVFMGLVNGMPTALVPGAGIQPSLEGEITLPLDGNYVKCRTAYSILLDEIAKWTPEEVSKVTEVSVADIKELAAICMDKPVYHYEGYGPQAFANGTHPTEAGLLMCAMVGNLGFPGASHGAFWGVFVGTNGEYSAPTVNTTGVEIQSVDYANVVRAGALNGTPVNIKCVWVYTGNPINTATDTNVWLNEILPSIDTLITADSVMSDTARYSDFVLPVSHWFEWEDVGIAGQTNSLHISEKCIDPIGESKPDFAIIAGVADKLGFGDKFDYTNEEILRINLEGAAGMLGMGYRHVKEKKQVRYITGDAETAPHIAWEGGTFAMNQYQRFAFYLEAPAPRAVTTKVPTPAEIERERLPRFFAPAEGWSENPKAQEYPIVLMSERPRYRVHSQWATVPLLRELDPEPFVMMNPKDAAARGLADGSYVECYNDRGHAVAKLVYSDGIRPGCAVYPKGWPMKYHKAGSWSELSSTDFDVFTVNYNFMDVLCEVRPWKEA